MEVTNLPPLGRRWAPLDAIVLRGQDRDPQAADRRLARHIGDSAAIDTACDGEVINIALADVPEQNSDLVKRTCDREAPKETTGALKVIDMLGEEVLVTERV